MANKRMLSLQIVDTDAFLDMPISSQLLYFHLVMRADDEGFVGNPKKIMRLIGVQEDDMKVLLAKRFLLSFDSGIVVIKHWLIHNTIRMDRFNETTYLKEKNSLSVKNNKAYTEKESGNQVATIGEHNISKVKLIKVKTSKELSIESLELTTFLNQVVMKNFDFIKPLTESKLRKDAVEMDRLIRIDKRDPKLIKAVIEWATQDEFWSQNIRSASKLRKQFDTLLVRLKNLRGEQGIVV